MNDEIKEARPVRRLWPWLLLAGLLLGIILFIVWVWFAVQGVKRIKASSDAVSRTNTNLP